MYANPTAVDKNFGGVGNCRFSIDHTSKNSRIGEGCDPTEM